MARLRRGRQGHRNEGFMQRPLRFYLLPSVWAAAPPSEKKQADIQADSDHTANVCLSYLDIRSKHLNQVVLNGPHPLLIETQAVPDNLICLRNGGDINSTWLRQWPPSVVGIKPIQHFIIPSLSGESRRTVSLYLLFSAVPLLPPSLSLRPPAPDDTSIPVADKSIINMRGAPVSCR